MRVRTLGTTNVAIAAPFAASGVKAQEIEQAIVDVVVTEQRTSEGTIGIPIAIQAVGGDTLVHGARTGIREAKGNRTPSSFITRLPFNNPDRQTQKKGEL